MSHLCFTTQQKQLSIVSFFPKSQLFITTLWITESATTTTENKKAFRVYILTPKKTCLFIDDVMSLDVNHSILFSQTQRYEKKNQSWKTAAETAQRVYRELVKAAWFASSGLRVCFFLTYQHSNHIHSTCILSR